MADSGHHRLNIHIDFIGYCKMRKSKISKTEIYRRKETKKERQRDGEKDRQRERKKKGRKRERGRVREKKNKEKYFFYLLTDLNNMNNLWQPENCNKM